MNKLKLYSYFRSSSAYRVRIALNLKNIEYEYIPIHLLKDGGDQTKPQFKSINPICQVPCLDDEGHIISQSMAIITYLDKIKPEPILLPPDPLFLAQVIEVCEIINSGIQPLQNLAVLKKLKEDFSVGTEESNLWSQFWIEKGFIAIEQKIKNTVGKYCFGNQITAADAFLIPQVYNAKRFQIDLNKYPTINKVNQHCLELEAFQKSSPGKQPDTPSDYISP